MVLSYQATIEEQHLPRLEHFSGIVVWALWKLAQYVLWVPSVTVHCPNALLLPHLSGKNLHPRLLSNQLAADMYRVGWAVGRLVVEV